MNNFVSKKYFFRERGGNSLIVGAGKNTGTRVDI